LEPLITTNNILLLLKKNENDGSVRKILEEHPNLSVEKMYLKDAHLDAHSKGNYDSMLQT